MVKVQTAMVAALLALSGCAAIQGTKAKDSENILAEAGFTRQPLSAAQGASSATALPARQLTRMDGAFEFYDPQFCQCLYVGGENEYRKLQQLRAQRLADHAWYMRAYSPMANSPDPELWDAWAPEGLDAK